MAQDKKQSTSEVLQNVSPQACKCVVCEKADGNLMCGQCYYDKFIEESLKEMKAGREKSDAYLLGRFRVAAKKAAGL